MDKIRDVLNVSEFRSVDYIDTKCEARKEYLLDRDAFVLLVMNYQGYNDLTKWKPPSARSCPLTI